MRNNDDAVSFTHSIRDEQGKSEPLTFSPKEKNHKEKVLKNVWHGFDPDSQAITINLDTRYPSCVCFSLALEERYFTDDTTDKLVAHVAYVMQSAFRSIFRLREEEEDMLKVCLCNRTQSDVTLYIPHFPMSSRLRNEVLNRTVEYLNANNVITPLGNHGLFLSTLRRLVIDDIQKFHVFHVLDGCFDNCSLKLLAAQYQDDDLYEMMDLTLGTPLKPIKTSATEGRCKIKAKLVAESMNGIPQSDKDIIVSLCSFIKESRTVDYNGFIEMGQCLFDVTDGKKFGLEQWKEVTKNSPVQENHDMVQIWSEFKRTSGDGIRTLRWYASQDDRDGYLKWKSTNTQELLAESLKITGGKSDVAKIIYNIHNDSYVCSDYKNNQWYCFTQRWKPMDGTVDIKRAIFDLIPKYQTLLSKFNSALNVAVDEMEQKSILSNIDRCVKMIQNLKDTKYREAIAKECADLFYDEGFERNRDRDTTLLGFEDKVYDTKIMNFRPARSHDRVTMSCGYNAPVEYHLDHPFVIEVLAIVTRIITNVRVRNFFWKLKAYAAFEPGNLLKMFVCLIGESNGGKSTFEVFSEAALGEYWTKPPLEQLTYEGQGNPDGATASKEILRFAREVQYSEPSKGSSMNTSFIKTVSSGGDSMYSRNLHQIIGRSAPTKFTPGFVPIYTSNYVPKFDGTDTSMLNRIVGIKCDSRFIDPNSPDEDAPKVPDTEEEQIRQKIFRMDDQIRTRIKTHLYPAYMWLLTHYYKEYRREGLHKPEEVVLFTKVLGAKNDVIKEFLREKTENASSEHAFVKQDELYRVFKGFYTERYPSTGFKDACMDRDSFDDILVRKGYVKNKHGNWAGLSFRK